MSERYERTSARADGRASDPVLQSVFLVVLAHSAIEQQRHRHWRRRLSSSDEEEESDAEKSDEDDVGDAEKARGSYANRRQHVPRLSRLSVLLLKGGFSCWIHVVLFTPFLAKK